MKINFFFYNLTKIKIKEINYINNFITDLHTKIKNCCNQSQRPSHSHTFAATVVASMTGEFHYLYHISDYLHDPRRLLRRVPGLSDAFVPAPPASKARVPIGNAANTLQSCQIYGKTPGPFLSKKTIMWHSRR